MGIPPPPPFRDFPTGAGGREGGRKVLPYMIYYIS